MTEEIDATTSSSTSDVVDLTSDVAASETMTYQRIQWAGGPAMKQVFSLPESIIYYIAKNPSSAKGYLKLVQTCKYFFEVNPILVAAQIHGDSKICSKTCEECNNGECCIDFDIKKCLSKIWLTNELLLSQHTDPNYTSLLCPKLCRCEIDVLSWWDKTVLLDDFKFLASSVTSLNITNVRIINNDGNVVSIDEILEYVPKLKVFYFIFSDDQSTSALKSIAKLNDLAHLERVVFKEIPEIYSIEDFSSFIKAHKDMIISLGFDGTISEDYKNQLDALVDAIIESEFRNKIIEYDGQDNKKFRIMARRRDDD